MPKTLIPAVVVALPEGYSEEDFDGTWSGSPAAPSGWTVVNNDGDSYTWSQANTYVPEVDGYGAHGMGSQNDYLITPRLSITGADSIKWWDVVESSFRTIHIKYWFLLQPATLLPSQTLLAYTTVQIRR